MVIAPRTVDHLLGRYGELVSVVLATPASRTGLRQQGRLILAVDGLQPDKGHEVLWVVRDVLSGDILLARSLLASGREDLSALLGAALLGLEDLPVVGVIGDGQQAIRQAVADVLPGVPHQLCQFHDLREAGRPIWEADRHAQKELRKRIAQAGARGAHDRAGGGGSHRPASRGHPQVLCGGPGRARRQRPSPARPRRSATPAALVRHCRQPGPGGPKRGVPAPPSRLRQAVRRALESTAPLWPERVIGQGWSAEAAYRLAHPDGADRATVAARYAVLLADIQDEAAPSATLQAMAAQFAKVTASYGPPIFTCYDVPD